MTERLRRSPEIARVLRSGRRRAGHLVVVHAAARDDAGPARLAVVASRRVGGAVERNRAKRLLREAARRLDWREDIDVVLVARASAAGSVLAEVERELTAMARATGALSELAEAS